MNLPGDTPRSPGLAGWLTRGFITSPLTPLFLIAALAFGLLALISLPREEEPQISVPMVDIRVQAPGLRAEDAVKLVTEPLETIVKGIDGVEHIYSQTQDDGVLVTARFLVGTPSDAAVLRVHDKLRANMDRIPMGIPEPQVVGRGIDDVAIVALTLSARPDAAERVTGAELTRIARELRTELAKIDDVGLTYLIGETDEAIRIAPDPGRLALYGITLQQLAGKVQGANRALPAGLLRDGGQQVMLVAGETLRSPEEIGNLVLTARDGRPVYVRDVADVGFVTDTAEALVATVTDDSGRRPAVTLAVAKRAGANAVTVAEAILHRAEALQGTLIPDDMQVEITRDYGETANEKANELLYHLGLATLSIIALVWLAIGRREALVVAVVIPVTILLTLFASWIMGYTLNRVSLFALIFSIGILVDDAIVVIENIARHWGMVVRDRRESAIEAVIEVGNPTIVATLTVVVALLPMLFVSGMMGPYMSPIPSNASVAMIFSFFVAVTVTPWLMLKVAGRAPLHHDAEGQGGRLGRAYAAIARPVLASKGRSWLFLGGVIVLTFGSLALFYTRDVTVKLLPFDNKSELSVTIDLPEGAAVETTDAVAQVVAGAAMELPEVISVQTHAAAAAPFNFNGLVRHSFYRTQPHQGEVAVNLTPKHDRDRSSHQIALDLRARLQALAVPPGTVLKVVEPPPGPPVMATLLAEIYGPDPETRRAVGEKVEAAFRLVPFIVDVDNSWGEAAPRLRALISPDDLDFYGVAESDVFDSIAILNGSTTVGYSHRGEGRAPIPIRVERPREQRVPGEDFLTTPIPADLLPGNRGVVELGDVVRIEDERASHILFRHNGRPAEMVTAELAGDFEAPLYGMLAVRDALEAQDWTGLPKPEIRLRGQPQDDSASTLLWDGEWEVTWVTFRDMGGAFAVALLGIYILVVAQFGSFRLPLVILTPVPLTFIGILGGHWLFGAPFSAPSMIGFIALAGIIVRNSILLVDFIRHDITGRPLTEVLIDAGAVRFRPILLTALAAMIGAAVILTDPIFQGLAISLFFGLISSTLLTVLVIPAVYRVFRT
ncbi:efflux RND transporter permease subunit [Paracoccus denitrificans]|jgi:multidrug efflux pump subunit AcrB|uniref:Acriflavin resistance protein n=1 Tax=Paracoccus denitrificans (strain Pd 1222) TaxID=318586 RepID=A1BB63_PARDP|nr:efflux RND transporter permease subunit [Paracoccus denitrificans]ABL72757.1 acriflavin resistance protein [Paracoccus denitrificans PD1222]MBB4626235.1 multidrug efflux pump subunit AcrB [Paracoccus denitrificans]MCU7427558.1 efflux RND transporter permease subunit [Paracoccus denitrificans]QAR29719.1 efflux RND transporter permease subunit [Paracoccus denitrificans]UPV98502.1 efflux RND transporter permease subunit [Paracoccus denitrificans]